MNRYLALAPILICALVLGCALVREPIRPTTAVDAGPRLDAPTLDAPGLDAPGLDAPGLDAPGLDAPMPDAPGLDAPRLDAPMPLDAPLPADAPLPPDAPLPVDAPTVRDTGVCIGAGAETCNGRDDNCNGLIDDGIICRACTAPGSCDDCVRFEAGGRVYQSCPPVTGLVYWRRICDTLGDGYDLAVPGDAAESNAIAVRLRDASLSIDAQHWIGVNDFETNGVYRRVDATPLGWAPTFSDGMAPRVNEGAATIQPGGMWDDYPLPATHRVLCEADPAMRVCTSTAADDSTCNGADDDCDGLWDENCTAGSCTARVFWDEVYYVCPANRTFPVAETFCAPNGGSLAVLDSRFALEFAADFTDGDTWVGLEQSSGGAEPDGGWAWVDGAMFAPADSDWTTMWDTGQPSSMPAEDCAFIKDSSSRLQDQDCDTNRGRTMCARPLTR